MFLRVPVNGLAERLASLTPANEGVHKHALPIILVCVKQCIRDATNETVCVCLRARAVEGGGLTVLLFIPELFS